MSQNNSYAIISSYSTRCQNNLYCDNLLMKNNEFVTKGEGMKTRRYLLYIIYIYLL